MNKQKIVEKVTAEIVAKLQAGVNPWVKPWSFKCTATDDINNFAVNYVTKKPYEGINAIMLEPGYYVTFKQAITLKGKPQKGKSHLVVFIATTKGEIKAEDLKEQILKEYQAGEFEDLIKLAGGVRCVLVVGKHKATVEIMDNGKVYAFFKTLKNYFVWNVKDVDGLKIKETTKESAKADQFKALEDGERVITGYVAGSGLHGFFNDGGDKAFYSPMADEIHIPAKKSFGQKANEYYSTAFHEMTHSTGHASRLNREGVAGFSHSFGSQTYSQEELIAEIGAAFLMGSLRIDTDGTRSNSAAYLAGWASEINGNKSLVEKIIYATGEAKKAFAYIIGFMAAKATKDDDADKEETNKEESETTNAATVEEPAEEMTAQEAEKLEHIKQELKNSMVAGGSIIDFVTEYSDAFKKELSKICTFEIKNFGLYWTPKREQENNAPKIEAPAKVGYVLENLKCSHDTFITKSKELASSLGKHDYYKVWKVDYDLFSSLVSEEKDHRHPGKTVEELAFEDYRKSFQGKAYFERA